MSLKDALKQGPPPNRAGKPCAVSVILSKMSKADADALRAELAGDRWPGMALAGLLREQGYDISGPRLNHHRAGRCRCGLA